MNNSLLLSFLIVFSGFSFCARADIYKCTLNNGHVIYTSEYTSSGVIEKCARNNRPAKDEETYQCTLSENHNRAWNSSKDITGKSYRCNNISPEVERQTIHDKFVVRVVDDDPLENSAIWGDCLRDGNELNCDFTQVLVDNEPSKTDMDKRIGAKHQALLDNSFHDENKLLCDYLSHLNSKSFANRVSSRKNDPLATSISSNIKNLTQAGKPYCNSPTKANALTLAKYLVMSESKTCHINARPFSIRFLLYNNAVWTHTAGPKGICGIVETTTLTEGKQQTWVFKSTRTITDRTGDAILGGNSMCDKLKEESRTYSFMGTPKFRTCEQLKFDWLW